jgi:putative oxidoreductase
LAIGAIEMICGLLVLGNFAVEKAVIPLFFVSLGAIITTQIPILLEDGFIKMSHEARLDFSLALSEVFLFLNYRKLKKASIAKTEESHRLNSEGMK